MKYTIFLTILLATLVGGRSPRRLGLLKSTELTTEIASAPTASPIPYKECSCTPKNIWLDIHFLIDASETMQYQRMDNAIAFILSAIDQMTIGQEEKMTRAGFITFAKSAIMQYNLTQFRCKEDATEGMEILFDGSKGANIKNAIRMASKDLYGSKNRTHVQKVIVIVASAEHEDLYEANKDAANEFKALGGHIITIEYTQEPIKKSSGLGKLASEGSSFDYTNFEGSLTMEKFLKALCRANCFCPRHHLPYEYPGYGCFRTINIPAIRSMSARNCEQHYSVMPNVESLHKATFLNLMMPWRTKFWIGLQRVDGVFKWIDGTELAGGDYQPWAEGYPKKDAGDCVYMTLHKNLSLAWFNTDCNTDLDYACQIEPCDTDHYCNGEDI